MHRIVEAKLSRVDRIMASVMLSAVIIAMIQSPSIIGGVFIVCLLVVIFFTFTREEVVLDETGDGVIESKIWTLTGVKKYRYHGLAKAKAVILEDIGSEAPDILNYLQFEDGHKLLLPRGKNIPEAVKAWFKTKYDIELEIIAPEKWSCMNKWKCFFVSVGCSFVIVFVLLAVVFTTCLNSVGKVFLYPGFVLLSNAGFIIPSKVSYYLCPDGGLGAAVVVAMLFASVFWWLLGTAGIYYVLRKRSSEKTKNNK